MFFSLELSKKDLRRHPADDQRTEHSPDPRCSDWNAHRLTQRQPHHSVWHHRLGKPHPSRSGMAVAAALRWNRHFADRL